jgi:splicing factor 3B subunit 2
VIYSDDDMASDDDASDTEKKPLSKKKQRRLARLTVAELKQLVKKPEVVEWTDVSAADPRLLLTLKSYRNTVPIPAHWAAKRDYLQGKRGIEKPPFQLPSYIADTGIATMRDAIKEKEAGMSLKAKTRERVQPKMGKVDIDYQKLHDAFFKFATKPVVTAFGEMCGSRCPHAHHAHFFGAQVLRGQGVRDVAEGEAARRALPRTRRGTLDPSSCATAVAH